MSANGLDRDERPRSMEIDLGALVHNYAQLRAHVGPEVHIIPALKANAYGHGAGPIARSLGRLDVHSLSTGNLEDALAIRAAGVDLPILMFGGTLPRGLPALLEQRLTPTIYDFESAEIISRASPRPVGVYVKVDAGLGRLGVPLQDAFDFVRRVARLDHIVVGGVYTHLSFFDEAGKEWARKRLAAFDRLLDSLESARIEIPITQALSSAGILMGLASRANAVCPGSLLYGFSPVAPDLADLSAYRPVLRAIRGRLIHVGPPQRSGRVGVIPLGLVDGYRPIVPPAEAYALIGGRRARIRGVSLEHMVLDLADASDARVGDEVVLLGRCGDDEITLDNLAQWQGTHTHHVLMAFDRKLPYSYFEGSRPLPR